MNTREILRKLLDRERISEWQLSDATSVSQSTINAILKGRSKEQKDSTLEPLAVYFGVSLKQIRGYEPIDNLSPGTRPRTEYPILMDCDVIRLCEGYNEVRDNAAKYVNSTQPKGPRTFVYTVKDDAMAPIISNGGLVFVDPDFRYPATQGSAGFKLALINVNGHLAIRQETTDLGTTVYKALADGFRIVSAADTELIGYVVGIPEQVFTTTKGFNILKGK